MFQANKMKAEYWDSRRALRLVILLCASAALLLSQKPVVRIGIVLDGPATANISEVAVYQREITELLSEGYDVRFPEAKRLEADWTAEGVDTAVSLLLADPDVDCVLTLGIIGSHDLARRGPLPKPGYAVFIPEPDFQGVPIETRQPDVTERQREEVRVSGVENLVYILAGEGIRRDVEVFHQIVPFTRMTVLYTEAIGRVFPEAPSLFANAFRKVGIEIIPMPVGADVDNVLAAIPSNAESVYVSFLPRLSEVDLKRLIAGLNARRLPTFSAEGRNEVELGVLATLVEGTGLVRRARRVATNMLAVLSGTPAAELPVDFGRREQLVINMATARAIGFSPAYRWLLQAELLHKEPSGISRTESLDSVVREAEGANLDLAAADRAVAAGLQLVKLARSPLLPQAEISGGASFIDKDRALLGAGQNPQRLAFGALSASQLLYSDDVWASYKIEKRLQEAREEVRAALRLDIILEAAEAYLNVLRAKTAERVQSGNLSLTRSNTELARVRVEVGQAGREELYRWQSQEAANKRDLVEVQALRSQAEIALNRILNRSIEETFETVEAGLDDPQLVTSFRQIEPYIESPAGVALFRSFMAQEAFAQSPELRQLQAQILAQRREVTASERSFYVPRVSVSASGAYLGRYGAGSEGELLGGLFFTNPWNWQVGVTGSLPLFQGGEQQARLNRAREELQRTTVERDATQQRIEEGLRSAVHRTGASYLGIELAQDAAEAARRNLDLVKERYGEGIATILALLDAQNQALVADLAAANAIFDYLIDLMGLQRAAGRFDYYRSTQDRQEFLNRMDDFYRKAGYEVRKP